jgi:hypothetical protein
MYVTFAICFGLLGHIQGYHHKDVLNTVTYFDWNKVNKYIQRQIKATKQQNRSDKKNSEMVKTDRRNSQIARNK